MSEPEQEYVRIQLPNKSKNELVGIVEQMLGASHAKVVCEDNKTRLCRLLSKLKKKMWVRENDFVIVKPWSFQPEKGDIVWRYTKTEVFNLDKRNLLPQSLKVFLK